MYFTFRVLVSCRSATGSTREDRQQVIRRTES